MKVDIGENHGGAEITCYCGPEKVKISHKEPKKDAEGNLLNEADVFVALLDAASAAVGSIPKAEEAPEGGETKAEQKEREERNAKALADWQTERTEIEAKEEEEMQAKLQAEAPAPPPQEEPQQGEPQPQYQ